VGITRNWQSETNVLVVGSGAAALVAAIAAHDHGARVRVVERSDLIGGTTAVSGGGMWIPLHHHVREAGPDTREAVLDYIRAASLGRSDDTRLVNFLDNAATILKYLEDNTPLRTEEFLMPDYRQEKPGSKPLGRCVEASLWDPAALGSCRTRIRPGHVFAAPALVGEFTQWSALLRPENAPMDLISERLERGLVATGNALVGMLLKGCLDRGISVEVGTRVVELIKDDGRLTGVYAERDGKPVQLGASVVVLACGGFEWNRRLRSAFLPGRIEHPNSPPFNKGDALLMAMQVGADLDNMTETWGFPSMVVPNETYEGAPLSRLCFAERHAPHSMIVNRRGRRFANEASNYNDMPKAFQAFDPTDFDHPNTPAWAIVDSRYRESYSLATIPPGAPDPEWLDRDTTLAGLAAKVGIDPDGLALGVGRFNELYQKRRDIDFGRGKSVYDQFMGDKSAPHLTLGSIEKPPFYAVPIYPGTMGTKGGPRINVDGQVIDVRGTAIPGLYGAGNSVAAMSGPANWGGGGTLGPAVVDGWMAGRHAAGYVGRRPPHAGAPAATASQPA
jgi:succinate dehydrogenase/fumarate reductase flavoprotein subunit